MLVKITDKDYIVVENISKIAVDETAFRITYFLNDGSVMSEKLTTAKEVTDRLKELFNYGE